MTVIREIAAVWILALMGAACVPAQTTLGPTSGGLGSNVIPAKGKIPISNGTTYQPGDPFVTASTPAIVHKATNNVGGATVKTLSTTITSTAAGNSLIVAVGAGEVANGSTIVLTVTDTNSDACSLAAVQAVSTTFAMSIYYCPNISAANTAGTATFSGGSSVNTTIAMEVWEVSGLITLAPQMLDATAVGTSTGTTLLAGQILPVAPNDFAFAAFGVGTAAQTVTLTGTGTWSNDSGQVNPASASGLFSFVGASQWIPAVTPVSAGGTITSEPWAAALALFRPVALPISSFEIVTPKSASAFTVPVCTAAMTGTTSTVTIAAPSAGLRNYVTSVIATNSSATPTFVEFQDGSTGTTLWEGETAASGGGFVTTFTVPLRQPTAGNGLYVQDVTTGANVIACATGFTGP